MLRITIAIGEAKGNERTSDKSYSNTLASCKESTCFAMKPDEMGLGGGEADKHHSCVFRDKTPGRIFQATGLAPVISPRKQYKVQLSKTVILSPIC